MSRVDTSLPYGTKVPNHIAIIPDGNRRWARCRGLHPTEGHKRGAQRTLELMRIARKWGIHTITFWGLSTENWLERNEKEVKILIEIIGSFLDKNLKEAQEDRVKIIHLGRKDRLPKALMNKIVNAEEQTKNNKNYILNLALDYGGQDEVIRAVQNIIRDKISPEDIDKDLLDSYTDTHDQPYPYPDFIIRTSGEQRTSGLFLWQSPYAETYWEHCHLPDFTVDKLREAILDYSRRRRRFGGNDSQKHFSFKPEAIARLELNWWRLENIPKGTRLRDYVISHIKEQFGLSKNLAKEAAKYMLEALIDGKEKRWKNSISSMKKFYQLVKDEIKLAFEPSLAASLQVKLWRDLAGKESVETATDVENTARDLYSEVYRISAFQAAKLARLRILATIEKNLAERGYGEHHWDRAEDYLQKFYAALKERVA
jgi:undecaprenyl diphosphate synthase